MSISCKGCSIPTLSDSDLCDSCHEIRVQISTIIEEQKDLSSIEIGETIMDKVWPMHTM